MILDDDRQVHSLIPGEVIKGQHPALVTEILFLKANDAVTVNPHKRIAKKFKNVDLPLKSFIKDELTNTPFTGYLKKGHYYYKTRGKGAAVNERADLLNDLFMKELNKFRIEDKHKVKIADNVNTSLREKLKLKIEGSAAKKRRITELEKDIECLELHYIKSEFEAELYQKYRAIFQQEKEEIEKEMAKSLFDSSNLESVVKKVVDIASNPLQVPSDYDDKQRLQYLIFPEGIWYNKKERVVRTPRVNSVFACIIDATRISTENKKGYFSQSSHNFHLVVPARPK
jgi:site-specific DNA recombinase